MASDEKLLSHQKAVEDYFEATAHYWEELYEREDVYARVYQERSERVLQFTDTLGLTPESRLLEIGCGPGVTSVALARRGYVVYGIDIEPALIDMTLRRATRASVSDRVRAWRGDVHNLTFPDRMFDLALAIGVMPWVASPQRAFAEMLRVLRPGGFLIVTADNLWALQHVLDPLLNPLFMPLRHTARRMLAHLAYRKQIPLNRLDSTWEFDRWLQDAGFDKLDSTTLGFGPFSLFKRELLPRRIGIRLDCLLQRLADSGVPILRSTGHVYIVLCRRGYRS